MSSISPDTSGAQSRTRIIAHRGACGYLPEHTAVAKTLAYGFGVDFIEQDVVATRDHDLVVLHDIVLDDVSDVALRYPDRRQNDGHFYVADFTSAELQQLTLQERRQPGRAEYRFPQRFPYALTDFRIMRFADEVRLIAGLNATTGRHVGIYPEVKDPAWHAERGLDVTQLMHDALAELQGVISGPVFIQSFDSEALLRLRDEFDTGWPLIQLLDGDDITRIGNDPSAARRIAAYAAGVGLPYEALMKPAGNTIEATALVETLESAGLLAHPYTMRRDAPDPAKGIGYFDALSFLIRDLQVDAIFCDQPDDALEVRSGSRA